MFKKDDNLKVQKKRNHYKPKLKLKLKFGDYGILAVNEGRLEFVQLNFIKKTIKIVMRCSKHIYEIYKKIWYNIVSNHVIQCKSKNSRMGKGKGLFERRIVRVPKNSILFEFVGIPLNKLTFLTRKINKKLNVKTRVFLKERHTCKSIAKHNFTNIYFKRFFKYN